MTIYTINQLATGSATVTLTDSDGGIDWLVYTGTYAIATDINLNWTYTGAASDGTPTSGEGMYFTAGNVGHRLIVNGQIENARGSNSADFIQGNSLANVLLGDNAATGLGGNDTISGGYGNDTIYGGSGADSISGGNGNDYLEGNAGVDIISGGAGRDIIAGGLGADVLSGGADGTDMLYYVGSAAAVNIKLTYGTTTVGHGGDAEGDTLNGFNQISGSAFDDSLTDTVANTIAFGYNANQFLGNAGNDRLTLGGGNDYGHGGVGNDTLYGGAGNDTLLGGDGTDYLYGGLGRDVQTGGIGADRFVFWTTTESLPTDRDVISDFIRSEGDKIDLRVIDADPTLALNQAFVWRGTGAFTGHHGDLRKVGSGTGLVVQGDVNGDKIADFAITVSSPAGALIATDFLL